MNMCIRMDAADNVATVLEKTCAGDKLNILDRNKHYMITFITKNRFGATDQFQIISEYDLSTNVHEDVAICNIAQDF